MVLVAAGVTDVTAVWRPTICLSPTRFAGIPAERGRRQRTVARLGELPLQGHRFSWMSTIGVVAVAVAVTRSARRLRVALPLHRRQKSYGRQMFADNVVVRFAAAAAEGVGDSIPGGSFARKRLIAVEASLQQWGYVAEVVYMWLGVISLGVASFAAYSRGLAGIGQSSTALGLLTVVLSVVCAFIGWIQARDCRSLGRACGVAARALEPGVMTSQQITVVLPQLGSIDGKLRMRQRTAWLGAVFAVVGLQTMVGLLVTKVLATSGGLSPAPGVSLDVFTLLAVSNAALSHIVCGGLAGLQQMALPRMKPAVDDPLGGWATRG